MEVVPAPCAHGRRKPLCHAEKMDQTKADADQDQQGTAGQAPSGSIPAATVRVEDIDSGADFLKSRRDLNVHGR